MRTVATLFLVVASLVATVPASAEVVGAGYDDCIVAPTQGVACQAIDAPTVGSPVPDPTYYVWVGPGKCVDEGVTRCRGAAGGTPGAAGTVVFSIVYEESNGMPGLQRAPINDGNTLRKADRTVLV